MAKKVLVDTGFWIALFDERDEHHEIAGVLEEELSVHTLLVPWPTLFECVKTRLVRRRETATRFRHMLLRPSTVLIDDTPYRNGVIEFTLGEMHHTYSLVDSIIRLMIEDVSLSIDAFVGFNEDDFRDVCDRRRIQIM